VADDGLYDDGGAASGGGGDEGGGADAVAEAASNAAAAAAATGSLDPKVLTKAIADSLGPAFEAIGGNMQKLAAGLQGLESRFNGPGGEAADETDFYSDPKSAVAKAAREAVTEAVGPIMQTLLKDKFDSSISRISADVDAEFGDGTYEEEFSEAMNDIIKDLPANLRASEPHLRMALDSLKGSKFSTLTAKAQEVAKKRAAEEASNPGYSNLGPGRPAPKAPRVSDDERQFIAVVKSRNPGYSEKQYLESRERGNTEDDWAHLAQRSN